MISTEMMSQVMEDKKKTKVENQKKYKFFNFYIKYLVLKGF